MTDSSITYSRGATTFAGPDAVSFYRAAVCVSALRLYAKTGMKTTRMATPSVLLAIAKEYTGKVYKRGEYLKAADDVEIWARTMKAALPVEDER